MVLAGILCVGNDWSKLQFGLDGCPGTLHEGSSGQTAAGGSGKGQFAGVKLARLYVLWITSAALTHPLRGSVVDVHNSGRLDHVGGGATRP